MSGRSSGYQLRDTNVARTPLRYRDYGAEQEAEPTRRTYVFYINFLFNSLIFQYLLRCDFRARKARQNTEAVMPKIETVASPQLNQPYQHHSTTRIYANAPGMGPEVQYEGIDPSASMINE
jgi:hypothetical protein